MALLGLFSRKDKNKSTPSPNSVAKSVSTSGSVADSASVADTSESYVLPDASIPTSTNGLYSNPQAATSSSKFNLGFNRKKAEDKHLRPPVPPYSFASTRSEADADEIRLPPPKSQLLSAYSDPSNAYSTRSLPDERRHRRSGSKDMANPGSDLPPVPRKSGGLFAWAHRERKKSKPSEAPPELTVDVGSESFNLKSFRHIRPESPPADNTMNDVQLIPPARPRPRENSVSSDTSQRISVAAFREMAAKRNTAGSPSMLLRPPSRTSSLENPGMSVSPSSSFQRPRPKNSPAARGSSLAISGPDTSSESEYSGESDSEDEGSDTMRPRRKRTITQKSSGGGARKATSELGHRMRSSPQVAQPRSPQSGVSGRSDDGQSPSQNPKVGSSLAALTRPRASVSTSALQPNAAAKRASLLIAANSSSQQTDRSKAKSRVIDSDTDDSSNSSSEDSDDAPLASFMRPPRPGSAASNATSSSSRPRMPGKPLIDISQINTPPLPSLVSSPIELSPPPMVPEKDKRPSPGFSSERPSPASDRSRITHSDKPSISDRLARVAQSATAKSVENLADAAPIERRPNEIKTALSLEVVEKESEGIRVPQPTRSQTLPADSIESSPAPTTASAPVNVTGRAKPNGRSLSSPNAAAAYDLTDPTPIVPTLIRERSPPPAFSVTSRPSSQLSLNTNPRLSQATVRMVASNSSTSSSPTSPTSSFSIPLSPSSPKTAVPSSSNAARAPFSSTTPSTSPSSSIPSFNASSQKASPGGRQRSSTLIPNNGRPADAGFTGGGLLSTTAANPPPEAKRVAGKSTMTYARPRASTVATKIEIQSDTRPEALPSRPAAERDNSNGNRSSISGNTSSSSLHPAAPMPQRSPHRPRYPFGGPTNNIPSPSSGIPPPKPFATEHTRGNSPASSTGGSSSSRAPLTPADGSDYSEPLIGVTGVVSALAGGRKGHKRISSVQFEDELADKERSRGGAKDHQEEKRRERRRSEAKAAIELGNVVNGRINLKEEDDDDDVALSSMGSRLNMGPMMNFSPSSPMNWQGNPAAGMIAPQQFMLQPNADPRFFAAHQQAMLIAKQAYQMAVAQQAMAAAEEEWERGSSVSAFGNMGMNTMGGMGMGGMGSMGGMGMGPMNPMMSGGYGMGWGAGPMMFANSAQSMYAGSAVGSEVGGPAWGTRSEYGGPTNRSSRTSAMYSNRPPMPNGMGTGQRSESQPLLSGETAMPTQRPGPRPRTKTAPSSKAPPSSWKSSQ